MTTIFFKKPGFKAEEYSASLFADDTKQFANLVPRGRPPEEYRDKCLITFLTVRIQPYV